MSMEIKVVENVLKLNDAVAQNNRARLAAAGVTCLNLISSPGSGKTTLLERTAERLAGRLRLGVVEGDLFTSRDAERIEAHGVPVVQINTRGTCHLEAHMVAQSLDQLDLPRLDLIFIENVGNLVCPSEYNLGEDHKVVVLSVSEGHDKPAKYPAVFRRATALVVNKLDLLPYTDFDLSEAQADARRLNPELRIFNLSARTGEGLESWCDWVVGLAKKREP